ncbi:hypothetical protein CIB93_18760 [Streptomyces sp. WZ.A104]|nr:hypothetical protein CIB93_18760 [Streptomyces sp. WZ.A104]
MCLLDNGTEGATKRFTASFAFSAACVRLPGGVLFVLSGVSRRVGLPESHPFAFGRIGHSSN